MQFLKDFARNLVILAVIGIVLYFAFPSVTKGALESYWMILGPLGIVVILVGALPRKRYRK